MNKTHDLKSIRDNLGHIDFYSGLNDDLTNETKQLIKLIALLPGINECLTKYTNDLIKDNIFVLYILRKQKCIFNGQYFNFLPNGIFFNNRSANYLFGEEIARQLIEIYVYFDQSKLSDEVFK